MDTQLDDEGLNKLNMAIDALNKIADARWIWRNQINNMVISDAIPKEISDTNYTISQHIDSLMRMPNEDGSIYGIPFIINKYMPKNIIILRNDNDIVAVININE